jgi:hypothetical protein
MNVFCSVLILVCALLSCEECPPAKRALPPNPSRLLPRGRWVPSMVRTRSEADRSKVKGGCLFD